MAKRKPRLGPDWQIRIYQADAARARWFWELLDYDPEGEQVLLAAGHTPSAEEALHRGETIAGNILRGEADADQLQELEEIPQGSGIMLIYRGGAYGLQDPWTWLILDDEGLNEVTGRAEDLDAALDAARAARGPTVLERK